MKMHRLVMTRAHTYGTRHLEAGDELELPEMDAIVMVVRKKARFAPKVRRRAPPADAVALEESDIETLRAEAKRLGISVDGRWGVIRLRHEIARQRM